VRRFSSLLPVAVLLAACSSASVLERVPGGEWGGQHVRLSVNDTGAALEFDCAHGRIDQPLKVDTEGRFDVPGTLSREGGPAREKPEPPQKVRYAGKTDGRILDLEVRSAEGEGQGSFRLELGKRVKLMKCL